jgi:hypothetical protein
MIPNEAWKFSIHECPAREHPKYCHVRAIIRDSVPGEKYPHLAIHIINCRPIAFHQVGAQHYMSMQNNTRHSLDRRALQILNMRICFTATSRLIHESLLRRFITTEIRVQTGGIPVEKIMLNTAPASRRIPGASAHRHPTSLRRKFGELVRCPSRAT